MVLLTEQGNMDKRNGRQTVRRNMINELDYSNQRCEIKDFSKIVTVSDEVYLYVILKGNNMKWKKKYTDKVEIVVLWYGCIVLILIVCFVES